MKSKTISAMNIYCSWVLVVIFAGFLILGLAYVHWLLFGAALSLIAFFLYSTNKLKCPKCGQRENLLRLTLALNHFHKNHHWVSVQEIPVHMGHG